MKLTTYLNVMPRSKNAWSYTSTPLLRLHGVVQGQGQMYLFYLLHLNRCGDWLRAGRSGFGSRRGLGVFLFTVSRAALSLGVGRPGRGTGGSPPSGVGVGNAWSCGSAPNASSWPGA
jgi:hypothetical protein